MNNNFEFAGLTTLDQNELMEVEGGIIPFLIGAAIGVTVAHYIATH
ncbi:MULTISPECIES: class IIb bacteriocin, lactobin A/cerein 7B family [Siphonobacter]|uniref:Class IIb bacteriocin, lactobin A/cerein 7B family n=1 Tax=Siphonobacter curvatus TaxID=2094562 RepID=A0A2S7IHD3_9BACT|nr:class IIb bacteriocin, lactobin A/cerein 7B family [Siphonobacter curvatus]PQA55101.1 hypothetical protein C5O19_21405 [Siphonobacter curvatus]PQA55104.1 hypothetical protein C5O19_21420 [Siphonobacter curvatus]